MWDHFAKRYAVILCSVTLSLLELQLLSYLKVTMATDTVLTSSVRTMIRDATVLSTTINWDFFPLLDL